MICCLVWFRKCTVQCWCEILLYQWGIPLTNGKMCSHGELFKSVPPLGSKMVIVIMTIFFQISTWQNNYAFPFHTHSLLLRFFLFLEQVTVTLLFSSQHHDLTGTVVFSTQESWRWFWEGSSVPWTTSRVLRSS